MFIEEELATGATRGRAQRASDGGRRALSPRHTSFSLQSTARLRVEPCCENVSNRRCLRMLPRRCSGVQVRKLLRFMHGHVTQFTTLLCAGTLRPRWCVFQLLLFNSGGAWVFTEACQNSFHRRLSSFYRRLTIVHRRLLCIHMHLFLQKCIFPGRLPCRLPAAACSSMKVSAADMIILRVAACWR